MQATVMTLSTNDRKKEIGAINVAFIALKNCSSSDGAMGELLMKGVVKGQADKNTHSMALARPPRKSGTDFQIRAFARGRWLS
jgi:hypothetical protein